MNINVVVVRINELLAEVNNQEFFF